MKRLGVRQDSGVVRASLVHYNTMNEIHCFGDALLELTKHG
jgi:selenocysteine lyase/cysteine desulfurase